MAITLEELQIKFSAETGALKSQLSGVQNQLAGLEKSADKAQSSLGFLKKAGAALGGAKIGRKLINVGKDALMMANDVVESEGLFEVSMGRMAARAREWSDNIGESLGLNPYDLRRNAGMLNVMFDSMGLGEQEAYDMSTSMVQLANDMASFYNMDTEEAFAKLRAGITGEAEPLKQLGVLIDENTIKQYAMANGIGTFTTKGKKQIHTMNQQQKVQARYGAIMQQTIKAQGDLARTMDSPTNQLRKLNTQFDNAKIALGQALQPALISVLPVMTNFATGLANVLSGAGVDGANPLSAAIVSLADATKAVRSGVDTSIIDTQAEIDRLKGAVETAVNEYNNSAAATKNLVLTLKMKPQSTGYALILKELGNLNRYVDEKTAQGITEEVETHLKVAMADGIVDESEVQEAIRLLDEQMAKAIKGLEEKKAAEKQQVKLQLESGEITVESAHELNKQIDEKYGTLIEGVTQTFTIAKAEVAVRNWEAARLSTQETAGLKESLQKEVTAAIKAMTAAEGVTVPLFAGTGLEEAVAGIFEAAKSAAIQGGKDLQQAIVDGTTPDWGMIEQIKTNMAIVTAATTGELSGGAKVQMALAGLKADPKTLSNFVQGFDTVRDDNAKAYNERYDMQAGWWAEIATHMPEVFAAELAKLNAEQGTDYGSLTDILAMLAGQRDAGVSRSDSDLLVGVADAVLSSSQQINAGNAYKSDVRVQADSLARMLDGIDFEGLTTEGKAAYIELAKEQNRLADEWWDAKTRPGENKTEIVAPGKVGIPGGFIPDAGTSTQGTVAAQGILRAERYAPGGQLFNADTLVVDSPKVAMNNAKFSTPLGATYTGRGGSLGGDQVAVAVDVKGTPVTMVLDGYVLARTMVKYFPEVTKTLGGGSGGSKYRAILE